MRTRMKTTAKTFIKHKCRRCSRVFYAWRSAHRKFCSLSCSLIGNQKYKKVNRNHPNLKKRYKKLSKESSGAGNYFYGKRGEKSPNWKGGVRIDERGYIMVNQYGKREKPQHRLIMEKLLGRSLKRDEVVHHINGKRNDNRIENLRLMSRAAHTALHEKERRTNGKN